MFCDRREPCCNRSLQEVYKNRSRESQGDSASAEPPAAEDRRPLGGAETLLVVEDEQAIFALIQAILGKLG